MHTSNFIYNRKNSAAFPMLIFIKQMVSNILYCMLSSGLFTGICNLSALKLLKLQMPVNNPEEGTQHSEHRESLKSRRVYIFIPGVS
jgi:hypothetical protein